MITCKNKKRIYLFLYIVTAVYLILFLPSFVFAQSNWEVLYQEDFEDGIAQDWELEYPWELLSESGNYFLMGKNHAWANYEKGESWTNYSLECKIKFLGDNGLHVNVKKGDFGRYFIGFNAGSVYLDKESPWGSVFEFHRINEEFEENQWHTIKIISKDDSLKIYVNDDLKIQYQDLNYLPSGSIAFETLSESPVYIDDIIVVGKPLPKPPPGYIWKRTGGPIGGLGYDIRIHPSDKNIMFVTDNPSGVNKSIDGGFSWSQKNMGISNSEDEGAPIFSLTIDPNNTDIVWAGTQDFRGIYKSTDGGETWNKKDNGVVEGSEISFRGFAIRPGNSDIVLAAAEVATEKNGIEFNKAKGKIYKTVNGGESWYSVWDGNSLARVLIFNPRNPDTVYCSTGIFDREAYNGDENNSIPGGEGILKSTNGGESWFNINNGIDHLFTGFLEMHPTNPQILYAASGNNAWQYPPNSIKGAVYKTVNGGTSWQKLLSGQQFSVVTISKSNPDIVYAGSVSSFWRSPDGGKNWEQFMNNEGGGWGPAGIYAGVPISAVVDPDDPDVVFVNNYGGGSFKSSNGTKSWKNSSKGYTGANIRDVAINPENSSAIYTIGRIGPFLSMNGGNSWGGISSEAVNGAEWYSIVINPTNSNEILISDEHNGTIYKSNNGGYEWQNVYKHPSANSSDPQNRYGFKAIVYAPSNPQILYAGLSLAGNHGDLISSKQGYGICKSVNGGNTWLVQNNGIENENINYIVIHPNNPDIVYAATLLNGIYKTTNGGNNWTSKNNGLPSANVRSLTIDPNSPNILLAGLGEGAGIAKTYNGGDLWKASNNGIQIQCPSSLSPIGRPSIGFALNEPKFNFFSEYYNIPWTNIVDIVFNPSNSNIVYTADLNSGVYLSSDHGETWLPIDDGLTTKNVSCLTISKDGQTLYAGTSGGGVFRLILGENRPPQILSTIPSTVDTISITYGDSLEFEAFLFDLNEDTLIYNWYFNDQKINKENSSKYLLKTADKQIGIHYLTIFVSDKDTTISLKWTIKIQYPTFINDSHNLKLESSFSLSQNYPNPFNSQTKIIYQIPINSKVKIRIFNLIGQEIINLVDDYKEIGCYKVIWDGKNRNGLLVASGIYICHIDASAPSKHFVQERKMVLIQ